MKIIYKKPLFWFLVRLFFSNAKWGEVILTFNGKIYSRDVIRRDLIIHEGVHWLQQKSFIGSCIWWIHYCFSKEFRLSQEIPAHQAQYKEICLLIKDRNNQSKILRQLGESLSSPVYGNIIDLKDAIKIIKS